MKATSEVFTLLQGLLKDLADQCSTMYSSRDLDTLRKRVEHEGLSFLTIALPGFADTVFDCIERGWVTSTDFCGYKKSGCLPSFLKGFTTLIFDKEGGKVLDDSIQKTNAIMSVRQIGFFFKKIKLPCSIDRIKIAYDNYRRTDEAVKRHIFDRGDLHLFDRVSRIIVSGIFPAAVDEEDFLPHHGPGSTQERIVGNRKYDYRRYTWFTQLDPYFSQGLNILPSEEWAATEMIETVGDKPFVRVVHVPKTLKSPRIIAMEPVVMQYLQQGLKDVMVKRIESAKLTAGHVNFTDQSINQRLALSSSRSRRLSTVDLSEASDRVHNFIAQRLFAVNPSLSRLIQATRSPHAHIGEDKVYLAKFASMGSALCFPVEALLFYVLALMTGVRATKSQVSAKTLYSLSRDVYVYGDDIILPRAWVDRFSHTLAAFALKMNTKKSYSHSKFRESCGMDAYDGVEITPVYMRSPLSEAKRRPSPNEVISLISTANQAFDKCLYRTAISLKDIVERRVGKLPYVGRDSEGLGWVDLNLSDYKTRTRFNRNLQRREVLALVPEAVRKKDRLSGVPALVKCLLKLAKGETDVLSKHPYLDRTEQVYRYALTADKEHLTTTPVRGALTLKRRWVTLH